MAKVNVYPYTKGKRLNTKEASALSKEVREDESALKKAIENDFEHCGYFTKEDGKGNKVKATMAAGNKVYFDRSKLNDDEIAEIKSANFMRLARNRMTKAVKSIRALINTANKAAYNWTDDQADKILGTLGNEMIQLENKLRDVSESKEAKGYSFDF